MQNKIKRVFLLAAALVPLFGIGSSYAEDQQQAFAALVGRGFKVVAAFPVPYKGDSANMQAIVTLQLDKAVAVCTFNVGSWENMTPSSLEDPKNCDVRFY